MPLGLLKYGFSSGYPAKRFLAAQPELKSSYDVVIIGGGGHGLATAYHLARYHGVRNVAVFEKDYIGGGIRGATRRSSAPTISPRKASRFTRNPLPSTAN